MVRRNVANAIGRPILVLALGFAAVLVLAGVRRREPPPWPPNPSAESAPAADSAAMARADRDTLDLQLD